MAVPWEDLAEGVRKSSLVGLRVCFELRLRKKDPQFVAEEMLSTIRQRA